MECERVMKRYIRCKDDSSFETISFETLLENFIDSDTLPVVNAKIQFEGLEPYVNAYRRSTSVFVPSRTFCYDGIKQDLEILHMDILDGVPCHIHGRDTVGKRLDVTIFMYSVDPLRKEV